VARWGFGFVIEFMEHLQLAAASNNNAATNSCTLLITIEHTRSSEFAVFMYPLFSNGFQQSGLTLWLVCLMAPGLAG
jgi:hypothetical protein